LNFSIQSSKVNVFSIPFYITRNKRLQILFRVRDWGYNIITP
jgi:hypothetical protein